MADLMTDLAQVVTDANRMTFDNADPMRHSKRQARAVALSILSNACMEASQILCIVRGMESDAAELAKALSLQVGDRGDGNAHT